MDSEILKKIMQPKLVNIERVGCKNDGGYWIAKQNINYTRVLIGLGIFVNWSFEESFLKKQQKIQHTLLVDGSVGDFFYKSYWLKATLKFLYYSLKSPKHINYFRKKYIKHCYGLLPKWNLLLKKYNISFLQQFVGSSNANNFVTPKDILNQIKMDGISENSVFVKMDIEGNEYEVIPLFQPYFQLINGFAIEFHEIQKNYNQFISVINLLKENYCITFTHNNNYSPLVNDSFSSSIEVSFLKTSLIVNDEIITNFKEALKSRISVCDPTQKDTQINWL